MVRFVALLLVCSGLHGCYYMQAAAGQFEVMNKREPVDAVINDPETDADLKERLQLVAAAREFSITELGLPDNDSYRTYADLGRDYVVWNIFAAPEFSLQPKQWCFPVAGCVSYRGYFSRDAAEKHADKLRGQGFDVAVGGISAYSTLGRFSDPVLSTMMSWDDTELVGTLFHELAHQVIYVKGDSGFNESFAMAVEEAGVRRWLESTGNAGQFSDYLAERERRRQQMKLLEAAREDLEVVYSSDASDADKRYLKEARLQRLVQEIAQQSGGNASGWLSGKINNAHLASMSLYEGRVPFFRQLLADCEQDFPCFYAAVRERAARPPASRYD